MKCPLTDRMVQSIKRDMDRTDPGWTETEVRCPPCQIRHVIVSDQRQLEMLRASNPDDQLPAKTHRLPRLKPGTPENWCRWHETTSPELAAPCAWETCRARVHVHRDALGAVRSGRAGAGFLVQRCPACHRYNYVQPIYGGRPGIRTAKAENGAPVLQMAFRRM